MRNKAKILDFPTRLGWIASMGNGYIVVEKFYKILNRMNEVAINDISMTEKEIRNLHYLNDLFKIWKLPTFTIIDNHEKIERLSFKHSWVLGYKNGENSFDMFIEAMTGLNEIALSGKDLTAGDRHAIIIVNKAIRKSELPLFTFDPPSLSENEVLPFSH